LILQADDYTGLWEFVWAEDAKNPDCDKSELFEKLQRSVRGLLADGQLSIYRGSTFTGEEKLVPAGEITALIDGRRSWEAPATGGGHLRVLTPDA